MAIAKLNEAMLYNMGFDRPAIDALRHLLRQVGGEVGAPTLPEVSNEAKEALDEVDGISQAPATYPPMSHNVGLDDLYPPVQQAQQIEFLETQVRSLAEQLVAVSRRLRDIEQGASL